MGRQFCNRHSISLFIKDIVPNSSFGVRVLFFDSTIILSFMERSTHFEVDLFLCFFGGDRFKNFLIKNEGVILF